MARDPVAGPEDGPPAPFPIKLSGKIVKGFGRGSKELGIPTANLPITGLDVGGHTDLENGIYFGYAGLHLAGATDATQASTPLGADGSASAPAAPAPSTGSNAAGDAHAASVFPMVMSIGWNPFYKNEVRSVEVHIIHKFDRDFYNALMNLTILGYIRPEQDYKSMDALIEDINTDIDVSRRSLERPAYVKLESDPYLRDFSWAKASL